MVIVFFGLYRETLPKVQVPTELPRSVRWQDAIFPPQIEKEHIVVFIARICEKNYQRETKLFELSPDTNKKELKI